MTVFGALVAQNVFFWIIAVVIAVAALRMVTTRNVVHAALYLVGVLAGLAANYILLAAEFVAITQVLVYIGAVTVLFLFGIMLTRARIGQERGLTSGQWPIALLVAALLGGVITYAVLDQFGNDELPVRENFVDGNTQQVSDSVFGPYLIPFEAVSVLLLAALVGAVILARRD
jgi:NADH-quinone oxidoreductase subunit J